MWYNFWSTAVLLTLFCGATAGPTNVEVVVGLGPNACTSDLPAGLGPTVT